MSRNICLASIEYKHEKQGLAASSRSAMAAFHALWPLESSRTSSRHPLAMEAIIRTLPGSFFGIIDMMLRINCSG